MVRVIQLKIGSIIREGSEVLDARSSVTLIESSGRRIVVDTGQLGEEGVISDALAARGLSPEDIDTVVNTHLHLDHCGCNILFRRATFHADSRESPPVHFRPTPDGSELVSGVSFMSTPGHTAGSVSVVADTGIQVYVMSGDAIPTRDNYLRNSPPAIHIDRRLAMDSMRRIIERADCIIPGHDALFEVVR